MHADAPVGAGMMFDPTGVESVVGFEFAPVRHRSAFEGPTCRFLAEHRLPDAATAVCVAVGVGAFLFDFIENPEIAFGCGAARCANRDGHGEKTVGAFHHIRALFAERNFDAYMVWIFRKFCRTIVSVICGESADSGTRARWDE